MMKNKIGKKLSGHSYKLMMKSLARKSKGSDVSIKKSEVNVAEHKGSNEDETTNPDSSFSDTQKERVDFVLRRVRSPGHAESSNCSSDSPETNLQETNTDISESRSNLDDISKLKEKSVFCENDCKSTRITFLEYWVPVKLSDVQTEQYCGSLFSNANLLCSSIKLDLTKNLHDVLVSTRKCCDHPYLVDRSLRASLIQGIPQPEQLDAEIKLSSKLLLLHKILLEIKNRGLRVLVLYQSHHCGSGKVYTGDFLDDIIHEKFGTDSFVRIDGWISNSKRKDSLKTFNEKGSKKFVCLMETRSCKQSTKLSSIDSVIFFNSDWDPMNDLRALQKINLDSQFEEVKVFRLYSSYTVEEKALILSKRGLSPVPEGNIMNIKQSTCHKFLTWGASNLLKKLDEFHALDEYSVISNKDSFLEDVFLEISTLLPNSSESSVCKKNSLILEVQLIRGVYPGNIQLLGEMDSPLVDEFLSEPPCVFWTKLLEGRNPRWKYFSNQSPRIRKSVQWFEDSPQEFAEGETSRKKCRREATSIVPQIPSFIRRRSRTKLQKGQFKKRKLSGGSQKVKCIRSELAEKIASWIQRQRKASSLTRLLPPTLVTASSAENHPMLPPNEAQAATLPPEDSVRPLESSQNSGNCQPQPPEASQGTHSEALQSACKALQIELERLEKEKTECLKQHEDTKLQIKMACEKELDEIRKKYDVLLQDAETAFVEKKDVIETRYNKVSINKSLAEAVMHVDTYEEVEESNQLPSLEVVPLQLSVASRTLYQPFSIPSIEAPQLMSRLQNTFSRNVQASCQLRSTAPHLRNMWRPPSV